MSRARTLSRAVLARHPLPKPDAAGDKDARGRVLAVGGSAEVPGAILLAGVAALRAGAGKLQLATVKSAVSTLSIAVPESLVITLPESRAGEISGPAAARLLRERVSAIDALLIGPGMTNESAAFALVGLLSRYLRDDALMVLDAAAVVGLAGNESITRSLDGRIVLTPHAGEMASLLDVEKEAIEAEPATFALEAAFRFGAVVALKGPESWIATPEGRVLRYGGGRVGLATSGSGDTLAGIVTGLAARGASPQWAAAWGVFLHGSAGRELARRVGPIGFLARELLDEIPPLMHRLG